MEDYLKGLAAAGTLAAGFMWGSCMASLHYEKAIETLKCECQCHCQRDHGQADETTFEPEDKGEPIGAESPQP